MTALDMEIPSAEDSCWTDLLIGVTSPACHTLAVQMMVFRLRQSVGQDPSPGHLAKAREELRAYFTAQSHLPSVKKDLMAIRRASP